MPTEAKNCLNIIERRVSVPAVRCYGEVLTVHITCYCVSIDGNYDGWYELYSTSVAVHVTARPDSTINAWYTQWQ